MYKRKYFKHIFARLNEPRQFIQVITGPRQTGKTTLIQQILKEIKTPSHYATSDAVDANSSLWIEQQWEIARLRLQSLQVKKGYLLVFDEIQKIRNWTETIKKLWDEDTQNGIPLKVVLLGSSPLLIRKGITETLAGRFELLRISHWSYEEMHRAFGFDLDQYIYFGGYPGSAALIINEERWKSYIKDSLIETTVSRDVLMMKRVDKPALLKRLFELGCRYSGQILSYNKMLGQLQEAGNTTTLAHYLDLLSSAGMLAGLQKYASAKIRQKSSSPKFQVLNSALISAQAGEDFNNSKFNLDFWGRLAESAVGAHLLNMSVNSEIEVYYWRERNREVDFVLEKNHKLIAIEVKSGKARASLPGMLEFSKKFKTHRKLLVGKGGLELEEFFKISPEELY